MTDTFRALVGRKLVSRASAANLGNVSHLLIDADRRFVAAVITGKGKKARLVDWSNLSAVGPDAVMVSDDAALREPANEREHAAVDGELELLGKRALTEHGNQLGTVADVVFDPNTGALEHLRVGEREIPAAALLAAGSYAAVLDGGQDSG